MVGTPVWSPAYTALIWYNVRGNYTRVYIPGGKALSRASQRLPPPAQPLALRSHIHLTYKISSFSPKVSKGLIPLQHECAIKEPNHLRQVRAWRRHLRHGSWSTALRYSSPANHASPKPYILVSWLSHGCIQKKRKEQSDHLLFQLSPYLPPYPLGPKTRVHIWGCANTHTHTHIHTWYEVAL